MSLPSSMDYTKILPIAAGNPRAMRRTFQPVNGTSFTATGNNIIRIELAANQFWDAKHSYLRMKITMVNAAGDDVGLDKGGLHSLIRRLRVEQAGSVLMDVNRYDRLLSAILLPCQSNLSVQGDRSITEGQRYANTGTQGNLNQVLAAPTGAVMASQHNTGTQIDNAGSFILSAPLVGGLFSQDKLVPLQLLSSSPLTIEIEISPPEEIGIVAAGGAFVNYTVDDVAYVASLVDVAPEVDQQIRMVQELSGGHIVLNSTDYTHFTGNVGANAQGQVSINVPARRKSIKSLLFVGASTTFGAAAPTNRTSLYNQSFGGNFNLTDYQVKIGSIMHPAMPIKCDFGVGGDINTRGEALMELTKCFMPVDNVIGLGELNTLTYASTNCNVASMPVASGQARYCPLGVDMEAFQRTAIESGVNTSDRSTPITLLLNIGAGAAEAIQVDAYVAYDALYYIDSSGIISVSH